MNTTVHAGMKMKSMSMKDRSGTKPRSQKRTKSNASMQVGASNKSKRGAYKR